jgi:hypothetical protein
MGPLAHAAWPQVGDRLEVADVPRFRQHMPGSVKDG